MINLALPVSPVHLYELKYFSVDHERVQEIRLKYHAYSKWAEVCESKNGADFTDQWQVFVDGWFSGRMDGWNRPTRIDHVNHFEKREDAVNVLRERLEARAQSYDERAQDLRAKARQII